MKSRRSTYPLRLPSSVKAEVERLAAPDGVSVNQFVASAVAEKMAAMNTAAYFAQRRKRVEFRAFDQLMRRKDGETPRSGDTMDWRRSAPWRDLTTHTATRCDSRFANQRSGGEGGNRNR